MAAGVWEGAKRDGEGAGQAGTTWRRGRKERHGSTSTSNSSSNNSNNNKNNKEERVAAAGGAEQLEMAGRSAAVEGRYSGWRARERVAASMDWAVECFPV